MRVRRLCKCPNCGAEGEYAIDIEDNLYQKFQVVNCDPEDSEGCDCEFVVRPNIKIEVEIFQMVAAN